MELNPVCKTSNFIRTKKRRPYVKMMSNMQISGGNVDRRLFPFEIQVLPIAYVCLAFQYRKANLSNPQLQEGRLKYQAPFLFMEGIISELELLTPF